jgi:hypothetical protein
MCPWFSSVVLLPTCLDDTRNFAGDGKLAETDAAQIELANVTSRPAAPETAVPQPDLYPGRAVFGRHLSFRFFFFRDFGCRCHPYSILLIPFS